MGSQSFDFVQLAHEIELRQQCTGLLEHVERDEPLHRKPSLARIHEGSERNTCEAGNVDSKGRCQLVWHRIPVLPASYARRSSRRGGTAELEVDELGFDKPSLELMSTPSDILPAEQGSHAFIA